jgi:hypothetical protein
LLFFFGFLLLPFLISQYPPKNAQP